MGADGLPTSMTTEIHWGQRFLLFFHALIGIVDDALPCLIFGVINAIQGCLIVHQVTEGGINLRKVVGADLLDSLIVHPL